ncbi:hypothetical protein EBM89_19405, partial [Cellulomonas triticagri]
PAGAVAQTHVRAVAALVTGWRGQGPVHLPGRVAVRRTCGRLALRAEPPSTGRDVVAREGTADDAGPGARPRGDGHR